MHSLQFGSLHPTTLSHLPSTPVEARVRGETLPTLMSVATYGTQVDESLIHQDLLRKIHSGLAGVQGKERPPLRKFFLGDRQLHNAVEASPLVQKIRANLVTKEEYMQYLVNLRCYFGCLEPFLAQHHFEDINFEPLYRFNALNRDIENLGVPPTEPTQMVREYHPQRFRALYEKTPYLLVAHAVVHYLGFLFGGQTASQRFSSMWVGAPVDLYAFGDAQEVLNTFITQIDAFGKKLESDQYFKFLAEIRIAWEFAGDIVDFDIRSVSRTVPAKL